VDFAKSLMVLLRRWYVALPALVISLGLSAAVYESVPAKYESRGTIMLLSSNSGATAGGTAKAGLTNPLLSIDGSLTLTSTALIQVVQSPEVAQAIYDQGGTAEYTVGDAQLGGPFINVDATGGSPTEVQRTVQMVLERTAYELRQREIQYKAPQTTYIQINNLVAPTEAKKLVGSKVRAAGAALALALAFSLSSAFMIESLMENRREKRRRMATKAGKAGKAGAKPASRTDRPAEPDDADTSQTAPIYGLTRDQVADLIDEVVRGGDDDRRGDDADERVRAKR
jgi:hypothetical protein